MKKSTLAVQGAASITVLALVAAMAQAKPLRYSEVSTLEINMHKAALVASQAITGNIIEAELEKENDKIVWEIEIVNSEQQVIKVEVDSQTGQILSTRSDDETVLEKNDLLELSQAIRLVSAIESGALIEAELETIDSAVIWELESLGNNNQENKYHVNAETGEILY